MNDALEAHTARRPTTHRPRLVGTRRWPACCARCPSPATRSTTSCTATCRSPVSRIRRTRLATNRSFRRRPSLAGWSSRPVRWCRSSRKACSTSSSRRTSTRCVYTAHPRFARTARRRLRRRIRLIFPANRAHLCAPRGAAQTRSTRARRAGREDTRSPPDSRGPPGHPRVNRAPRKPTHATPALPRAPAPRAPLTDAPDPIAPHRHVTRSSPRSPSRSQDGTDVDNNFSMLTSSDLLSKPVEDLKSIVKKKRNMTTPSARAAAPTRSAGRSARRGGECHGGGRRRRTAPAATTSRWCRGTR